MSRYILGIDGGGTKTELAIANEEGFILAKGYSGPSNWTTTPRMVTEENIVEGIESTLSQVSDIKLDLIVAGIAGVSKREEEAKNFLFSLGFSKRVVVTSDAHIALIGAVLGREGIIVISGTGSIGYGRRDNREVRSGGWGYLLGDEGSSYDVGRMGIISALRSYDGRGKKTILLGMLQDYIGTLDTEALVKIIYQRPKDIISGFAPKVVEGAKNNDDVALKILQDASYELGLLGISVAKRLNYSSEDIFDLAYIGGFFNSGEIVVAEFTRSIREIFPNCNIFRAKSSPVMGAVILGRMILEEEE
ncbi:MAG: BadF/BadG/BcrA/BcrD ATPase family protein [bacterium]